MSEDPVRHCPGCGQALRFPGNIGGMLMACPECGHTFISPFKLGGTSQTSPEPGKARPAACPPPAIKPLLPESPVPVKKATSNTMAARVAALYASRS